MTDVPRYLVRKSAYTPFRRDVVMLVCKGGREHPVRHTEREDDMPESTYDVIQLIGTSNESWEKAAAHAVEQASKSIRDVRIAEIVELDMQLDPKGKVEAYRAKVKLSFKYGAKS
jgi:flavin-binding protein dodecin